MRVAKTGEAMTESPFSLFRKNMKHSKAACFMAWAVSGSLLSILSIGEPAQRCADLDPQRFRNETQNRVAEVQEHAAPARTDAAAIVRSGTLFNWARGSR